MDKWFKHTYSGVGTCVHVIIDEANKKITRHFNSDLPTVSGKPSILSKEKIFDLFQNEVHWLEKLCKYDFVPKLIAVDLKQQIITQEFCGYDLLTMRPQIDSLEIREIANQLVHVQSILLNERCLKRNHAMSNMVWTGENLKIFDFKWAVTVDWDLVNISNPSACPEVFDELASYSHWVSKISPAVANSFKKALLDRLPKLNEAK